MWIVGLIQASFEMWIEYFVIFWRGCHNLQKGKFNQISWFNILILEQNTSHSASKIIYNTIIEWNIWALKKTTFLNSMICLIYNKPALVELMDWHQTDVKPLPEQMVTFFIAFVRTIEHFVPYITELSL